MDGQQKQQPTPQLNIVWEGSQFVTHSLALINREHCSNIIDSGVANLAIVPFEPDTFLPEGNAKFEKLWAHDVRNGELNMDDKPFVWIRHQYPLKSEIPHGAKWIINQPWEFSELRKDWVETMNQADEVWTPSNFCRDVFVRSGVTANKVQVIPNGIDPAIFTPEGNIPALPTKKRLKFLFVGGTIFRKGIDVLLDAYVRTFSASDDVTLIIKDMGGNSFYKGQTAEQLIENIRKNPNAPEILYTDATLTEQQMAELYRACDVFVSPYRGEGFSLPTLEAMACGLPVIVTNGGATDDFVDETVGWTIPAGERFIGSVIDGKELTGSAYMLEPDGEVLASTLDYVANNPQERVAKGIAAAHRARTEWTWKHATLKALTRLDVLYGTTMAIEAEEQLLTNEDDIFTNFSYAEMYHAAGRIDEAIEYYHRSFVCGHLPTKYMMLALHRMASFCLLEEDLELCAEYLEKAKSISPDHSDTLYVYSVMKAMEGRWFEALETLTVLLNKWEQARYETMLNITLDMLLCDSARALMNTGAIEEARELYTKALEFNPNNPDACYGAALCFKGVGAVVEAKTMLEWAIRLRPDFSSALEDFEAEVAHA
ncbi:MAG: glycosyltransferase [Candidatus Kapabacteria bacterium]|nr:glycosyltransferase [Candidatus Kapabacteria bacterium]MBX7155404.1 glycosyltransferase [Bacteroidota bacterium]